MIKFNRESFEALQDNFLRSTGKIKCGALLGYTSGSDSIITDLVELENEISEGKDSRYLISPQRYMVLEEYSEARGINLLGFYYFSKKAAGKMTEFDKKYALPGIIYMVLSEDYEPVFYKLAESRKNFYVIPYVSAYVKFKAEPEYAIAV